MEQEKFEKSIALIAGLVIFLIFIYLIMPALSPAVLFVALLYLFFPFSKNAFLKRLLWVSGLLFAVWLSSSLVPVLAPFIIAFILAYILNPVVNALEARKVPRWLSSVALLVLLIGAVSSFAFFALPLLFSQFQSIISSVSDIITSGLRSVRDGSLVQGMRQLGIPVDSLRESLESEFPKRVELIIRSLLEGAFGFISGISAIVTQLLNVIIIPFVAFYLLKDFPSIKNYALDFIPQRRKAEVLDILGKTDDVLSDYFRGAVVVAIIQGAISTIVLSLLGVKYAVVLGVMTALLDFIPYVGLLMTMIVSVIAALLSGDPVSGKVLGVVIMYLSQKIFENTVLAPKIIGDKIGIHPVILIISLFLFGYYFGFIGLLIAIPTTAVALMLFKIWREKGSLPLPERNGSA